MFDFRLFGFLFPIFLNFRVCFFIYLFSPTFVYPRSVKGEARVDLANYRRCGKSFELWEALHTKSGDATMAAPELHLAITYCPTNQVSVRTRIFAVLSAFRRGGVGCEILPLMLQLSRNPGTFSCLFLGQLAEDVDHRFAEKRGGEEGSTGGYVGESAGGR